jgi:hypothetical protein
MQLAARSDLAVFPLTPGMRQQSNTRCKKLDGVPDRDGDARLGNPG